MPEERDLHPILAGALILLAVLCTIAAILIGFAPGAWDPFGGVAVAFGASYAWLRPVIDAYLGGAGMDRLRTVRDRDGRVRGRARRASGTGLDGEIFAAYAACLAISALCWYRVTASA